MRRTNVLLSGAALLLISGGAFAQTDSQQSTQPTDDQSNQSDQSSQPADSGQATQPSDQTTQEPIFPSAEEPSPVAPSEGIKGEPVAPADESLNSGEEPLKPAEPNQMSDTGLTGVDATFAQTLAARGMAEVEASKMALERGTPAVRSIARRLVDDHQTMSSKLQTLSTKKGITAKAEVSPEDRQTLDRLAKLRGAEFDRAYLEAMLDGHKKTIQLFSDEINNGKDSDVMSFAAASFPTIVTHFTILNAQAPSSQAPSTSPSTTPSTSPEKPSTPSDIPMTP
jgi:putative membrane protein